MLKPTLRLPLALGVALVLLTSVGCGDDAGTELGGPRSLNEVEFWAYQIQSLDDAGTVDLLAATHYDLLVLEPTRTDWSSQPTKEFDTAAMVERLKSSPASDGTSRKLVLAYIDIGEAEDWRWYWTWSQEWTPDQPFPADWPDYILAIDPDGWVGNYPVAYWDPAWKDIIINGSNTPPTNDRDFVSVLDEVLLDGFDGVYLDWVEGFENEAVQLAAQAVGRDPAQEMIDFIAEIRAYGRVRNPDFLVIQQNAASLAIGRPELFAEIDAIAQEAIWYDGDATDDWNDPNGHDYINEMDLVNGYLNDLQFYMDAGLPVLDCEYALTQAMDAYQKSYARGYVPYVSRRSLSQLTTTLPPEY